MKKSVNIKSVCNMRESVEKIKKTEADHKIQSTIRDTYDQLIDIISKLK